MVLFCSVIIGIDEKCLIKLMNYYKNKTTTKIVWNRNIYYDEIVIFKTYYVWWNKKKILKNKNNML